MPEPRTLVDELERDATLPAGPEERFVGYGVMGLPFASGDILCLRRFPASSLGPAYTSVWHRDPEGRWTFYQNVAPLQACPRFFGSALAAAHQRDIDLRWTGLRDFSVSIAGDDGLSWQVALASSPVTALLNGIASAVPRPLWKQPWFLSVMSAVASVTLRAGRLGLAGAAPNGQRFIANPKRIWLIPASRAVVRGRDLGPLGPLAEQARLGDFWIPNRGLFAIGGAFFEPFDAARHAAVTSQEAG